jgi:hypothetical protein
MRERGFNCVKNAVQWPFLIDIDFVALPRQDFGVPQRFLGPAKVSRDETPGGVGCFCGRASGNMEGYCFDADMMRQGNRQL